MRPRDFHGSLDRDSTDGKSVAISVETNTTSVQVLKPNARRKQALIINISDTTIYLCKTPAPAVSAGIALMANGGYWLETPDTLGYLWRGPFWAINAVGAKSLAVTEDS